MGLGTLLLQFLWLVIPGAFANATPVFVKNIFTSLAKPIDGGAVWRGKRVLGDHKTWRGLIFGSLSSLLAGGLQEWAFYSYEWARDVSVVDFYEVNGWLFGFLMGFGALVGDAVKSFFKRRVGVAPGKAFFPWDQLDSYFGSVVFILIVTPLPWEIIVFGAVGVPLLHIMMNFFAYHLGLKKSIL